MAFIIFDNLNLCIIYNYVHLINDVFRQAYTHIILISKFSCDVYLFYIRGKQTFTIIFIVHLSISAKHLQFTYITSPITFTVTVHSLLSI